MSRKELIIKFRANDLDKMRLSKLAEIHEASESHVIRLAIKVLYDSTVLEDQRKLLKEEDKI